MRRAYRILLLETAPLISRLPSTSRGWADHLPTLSQRTRYWSARPETRVDWRRTRMTGWPPTSFAIRRRHRSSDELSLSVLAWTLHRLEVAVEASESLVGPQADGVAGLPSEVHAVLQATLPILAAIEEPDESIPTRDDLAGLRGLGWPWRTVADIASVFVSLERGGAEAMARRLLRPDGFPDVLFQLSVLGTIVNACGEAGATVKALRPIGDMTDGPVYEIQSAAGSKWDLWCEAANCWEQYGADDHYRDLAGGLTTVGGARFSSRHIRPDILLAQQQGEEALVLECKFPADTLNPGYVAHGMYQAAFYASQLQPAFARVTGYAVGPSEMLQGAEHRVVGRIPVGLTSLPGVTTLVRGLLA